jgi:hypothetical protein
MEKLHNVRICHCQIQCTPNSLWASTKTGASNSFPNPTGLSLTSSIWSFASEIQVHINNSLLLFSACRILSIYCVLRMCLRRLLCGFEGEDGGLLKNRKKGYKKLNMYFERFLACFAWVWDCCWNRVKG